MKHLVWLLVLILMAGGCSSEGKQNDTTTLPAAENTEDLEDTEDENTTSVVEDDNTTTPTQDDENSTVPDSGEEECVTYSEAILTGKTLYETNCMVCHNKDAKSGVWDIRNMGVEEVDWALANVVDMVELGLAAKVDATQREAIVAYLAEIAVNPAIADYVPCGTEEEGVTKADLGSRLFFDKSLSLRGNTSCSSCHNPSRGFADGRFHDVGDANPVSGALSVGDDNVSLGGRNAPTAAYAMFSPAFSQLPDGNYSGGQFHDGRAATLKDQAKGPFLDGAEMMMPDAASVVTRVVAKSDYVADFKALYGEDVFDDTDVAYDAVAEAITAFEKTDVFAPFDSKYDRSKLDPGDADYYAMSAQEATGYALFFSETMHCNRCHTINSTSEKATGELFTNYRYENIGRPKNLEALLARDGNTDRIDLGLGGRSDINDSRHYGKTKVPTLRNIAVTGPYMNNGVFKQLRTVLEFYDHMAGEGGHPLNPETNTSWGDPEVNATVDYATLHDTESLSDTEIDALEVFLKLLTDSRYESLLDE